MKVSLVGYTVPNSGVRGMGLGISRYIYYLGKELRKMGHDVELTVRDDFKPKEKMDQDGIFSKNGMVSLSVLFEKSFKKQNCRYFQC